MRMFGDQEKELFAADAAASGFLTSSPRRRTASGRRVFEEKPAFDRSKQKYGDVDEKPVAEQEQQQDWQ